MAWPARTPFRLPTSLRGVVIWILLATALAGCRIRVGPSAEVVKKEAEALFEKAARGEAAPANIPFTGGGKSIPKLLSTEITAGRQIASRGGEYFEYDVRLSYLNRIRQQEWATVRIRFQRRGRNWEPFYSAAGPR